MKLTRFLLVICCAAAALTACSKAEKVTKEAPTHPMTITLNADEALTKMSVEYNVTNKYIHKWQTGDAISVLSIIDEVGYNDRFELVSGAGTSTGVFSCATSHIPTSGTTGVRFIYPYTDELQTAWWVRNIQNQGNGSLANLGNYSLFFAHAIYTDGSFDYYRSDGKPMLQVLFFKFPAGLQLVGNSSGSHNVDIELSGTGTTEISYEVLNHKNLNTATSHEGNINLTGVALSDGKLVSETYIALLTNGKSNPTFSLSVKEGSSSVSYDLVHSGYLSKGTVYKFSQTQFTPVQNF